MNKTLELDQTFARLLLMVIISAWRGRPEWRSCPPRGSPGNTPFVFHRLSRMSQSVTRAKTNYRHARNDSFSLITNDCRDRKLGL